MKPECHVIERPAQQLAVISAKASMWKIPAVIGASYQSILAAMKVNGVECTEAPVVVYRNVCWEEHEKKTGLINRMRQFGRMFHYSWVMDIGYPVVRVLPETDSIKMMTLPAGRMVEAMHIGPYRKVGVTYQTILDWAKTQNLRLQSMSIEQYLNDPRTVSQDQLQTRVLVPLLEG